VALTGQTSFDDLGAPLHEVHFCVLDLETTGATAKDCEITEIGAVRFVGGEQTGRFQTLVNPGVEIPPFITVLTGITHSMVVEAPMIEEALPAFLEFIGDAVIVGHNIRFDMSFLNAAAERLGYGRLPNRTVDTIGLARRLVHQEVRNLKLSTLAAHFRSPTPPTHRAFDDAAATAHVFWSLLERAGTIGVNHLDDLLMLPTARGAPHFAKLDLTEGIPRRPGVYLFVDANDTVIYIGKAKNLRNRVRSYFYGDSRKTVAQMLRDLRRIDHRVCDTELEAEVTELRLIGAHLPRYNRRSRPPRSPHWVKVTDERFPRLSMVRAVRDDDALYLGPFRSRRAAEVVVHAIWDAVPIRRCNGRGGKRTAACSFSQLGVAICPCDGAIPERDYAGVVDRVRRGVVSDPREILEPLRARMVDLAGDQRFEEAADIRDRYGSLATALERRRAWQALQKAGTVWAEDRDGNGALVERGRLIGAWNPGGSPPLVPSASPKDLASVPRSVADAEEAGLIWKWLDRAGVEIIDSSGALALPARPIPELAAAS
jgi:DNA polymerase-3 subunit epsilon